MNPFALIFIALGVLLVVIGVKGSQKGVLDAFKGVKQGQSSLGAAPAVYGPGAGGQQPPSVTSSSPFRSRTGGLS